MSLNEIYDYLVSTGIATEEEIQLVTDINGWNEEALNDIVYARTGYRDMKQYLKSECYETEFDEDEDED